MILHYLVIWLRDKNMNTREETPVDLTVSRDDLDDAETRYSAILDAIAKSFNVAQERISVVNICRL